MLIKTFWPSFFFFRYLWL